MTLETLAEFVNRKALEKVQQEYEIEKWFKWAVRGHKHRLVMLAEHADLIESRQAYLGHGSRKRRVVA